MHIRLTHTIARGPIIDEDALIEALDSGKVLRAALDTVTGEPKINPKILAHPNIVSPRVAIADGADDHTSLCGWS